MLETFVEPQRFQGTCYKAANWLEVGETCGKGAGQQRGGGADKERLALSPVQGFSQPVDRGRTMTLERIEINGEEAEKLLDRVKSSVSDEDYRIIKGLIDTHLLLNQAVNEKSISIKRLLQMIFGVKTEKSRSGSNSSDRKKSDNGEKKARGHGRNGAEAYSGAEEVSINHQALSHCDPCPACPDGRLYRQPSPGVVVRIKGTAPLWATVYELEKLRCNICGTVFTAELPSEAAPRNMMRPQPPCWPFFDMEAVYP